MKASFLSLAMALVASATPLLPRVGSSNTPPVTIKGNAFYRADGSRFYIRGVDFQPGGSSGGPGSDGVQDPLADLETCRKTISKFKSLGANTVRVYTIDNSKSHDECMKELSAAGIYLALDVNSPKYSLNSANVRPSYNADYLQNIFATIDMFSSYDNTLLFFAGNEVINAPNTTNTAPFIKAVIRDMKTYMHSRGARHIPVGYSAADVEETRTQTADYLNCGDDAMARTDFFAFNDYSYCNSNFQTSGWADKVKMYSGYSVPIFLSEFGCIAHSPRTFPEIADLYSSKMTSVYSGGLVYQWTTSGGDPKYGLVDDTEDPPKPTKDYANLAKMYKANPSPEGDGGAKSSGQPAQCPAKSKDWHWDNSQGLPVMPTKAQGLMKSGAGKGVGLQGDGSQNSGDGKIKFTTQGSSTSSDSSSGSSSPSGSSSAAAGTVPAIGMAPFAASAAVAAFTLFGAALL